MVELRKDLVKILGQRMPELHLTMPRCLGLGLVAVRV